MANQPTNQPTNHRLTVEAALAPHLLVREEELDDGRGRGDARGLYDDGVEGAALGLHRRPLLLELVQLLPELLGEAPRDELARLGGRLGRAPPPEVRGAGEEAADVPERAAQRHADDPAEGARAEGGGGLLVAAELLVQGAGEVRAPVCMRKTPRAGTGVLAWVGACVCVACGRVCACMSVCMCESIDEQN